MMAGMRRFSLMLLLLVLLLGGGCANYQFNLVKPEQYAAVIGTKSDVVVNVDPLEYRFIGMEGYLVVRIKNPTGDAIELIGEQSSAIDSTGEAHPLRSQTIPPGAFIKVILPPPRPTVNDSGPGIGFGFGVIGRLDRGYVDDRLYDPYWNDRPQTLTLYDQGSNFYWDWNANTSVKVIFTYQRAGHPFHQDFTFFKQKL
jgi:hypothetical protein